MSDGGFGQIGSLWTDVSGSSIPTDEQRAAYAAEMRRGLPPVRHKVQMRYERLFDMWRVTLSVGGRTVKECRFAHDHTLEEMIRRGRGMTCLEDKQAVERGMRQGLGIVTLELDEGQMGALESPQ